MALSPFLMDDWTRNAVLKWTFALAAGTAVMLLVLLTGVRSLNFSLVVFLFTVKFLAGFGIVLAITSAGIFVLTKFEKQFVGEENAGKMKAFMVAMVALPVLLLVYYGPVKIWQSYTAGGIADNLLDKVLFVYGIASLLVTLYVIPLVKDEFASVTFVSTGEMVKKTLKEGVRGFKKRVFSWRKNLAKAQLQDHLSLKEFLELWRQRLAVVALLLLGLGNLIFTPIAVVFVGAWLRVYFFTSRRPFKFEVYMIVAAALANAVVAAMIPFVLELTPFYEAVKTSYYWLDVAYFTGLFLASALYLFRLTRDAWVDWKKRRKDEKIKGLKAERDSLKKELKAAKKEGKRGRGGQAGNDEGGSGGSSGSRSRGRKAA
ncbi:MAG: hypothetical protein Kow0069_28500 [Promethearchaeota archaeon]